VVAWPLPVIRRSRSAVVDNCRLVGASTRGFHSP
jgi:hypothetical protein